MIITCLTKGSWGQEPVPTGSRSFIHHVYSFINSKGSFTSRQKCKRKRIFLWGLWYILWSFLPFLGHISLSLPLSSDVNRPLTVTCVECVCVCVCGRCDSPSLLPRPSKQQQLLNQRQLRFFDNYQQNRVKGINIVTDPVADPGFPWGGGVNPPGGANIWFCEIFPNTARNLDPGACIPRAPLVPPMGSIVYKHSGFVRNFGQNISLAPLFEG